MQNPARVQNTSEFLKKNKNEAFTPKVGIVLGTGLGGLVDAVSIQSTISYADIPDFPQSTVASHKGQFILGTLGGTPVMLQQGRCHLYEGYSPEDVCMGVRTMAAMGVTTLIITNAAGALNPAWTPGDLMAITDHINFTGKSPLTGYNHDEWGPRFPDMSRPYDGELIELAMQKATQLGIRLERGVYAGVQGPQMETPAETRMYKAVGADAVGMSTVLEVIAARHMGLRVLGISCLTNKNLPDCMQDAPLEEVIRVANLAGGRLASLIEAVATDLNDTTISPYQ
ncbi:purine-nucleoside phosphorylase [Oleidesulfovibrio sp.]|uniref:purine-nucleoside phosphorylase n=1 Tax=Oleidesulfovibrio sp. TaxID=2909707 RepID=UPI003A83E59D